MKTTAKRNGNVVSDRKSMDNEGPLPSPPVTPDSLQAKKFDEKTKLQVLQCLGEDTELANAEIRVDIQSGNIILNGYVDTPEQKQYAETRAKRVNGIKEVLNQIQIRIQDPRSLMSEAKINKTKRKGDADTKKSA